MWSELFKNADMLALPIAVMVFFMLFFVLVLLRVCSRSRRAHYSDMSQLPLQSAGEEKTVREVQS